MNVASKCKKLLSVSNLHYDLKVHWDFLKGKCGWLSWDIKRWFLVEVRRWLLFADLN